MSRLPPRWPSPPPPKPPPAEAAEKEDFDVVLVSYGEKKINVIKEVRAITTLGLKEAKDLVEGAPTSVKEDVKKEEAEEIKKKTGSGRRHGRPQVGRSAWRPDGADLWPRRVPPPEAFTGAVDADGNGRPGCPIGRPGARILPGAPPDVGTDIPS